MPIVPFFAQPPAQWFLHSLWVWISAQQLQQQAHIASSPVLPVQHRSEACADLDRFVKLTLDVVHLPGLAAQHHDGDAGSDAGEKQVQQPRLAQLLGSAKHKYQRRIYNSVADMTGNL